MAGRESCVLAFWRLLRVPCFTIQKYAIFRDYLMGEQPSADFKGAKRPSPPPLSTGAEEVDSRLFLHDGTYLRLPAGSHEESATEKNFAGRRHRLTGAYERAYDAPRPCGHGDMRLVDVRVDPVELRCRTRVSQWWTWPRPAR